MKYYKTYSEVRVQRLDSPSTLVLRPSQSRGELVAVTDVLADAISQRVVVGAERAPICAYLYRPNWSGLLPGRTALG
jgi:hypothetical protein